MLIMKKNYGLPCGGRALPLDRVEGRVIAGDAHMGVADVATAIAK